MLNEDEFKKMAGDRKAYQASMHKIMAPLMTDASAEEKAAVNALFSGMSTIHLDQDKTRAQKEADIKALEAKFIRDHAIKTS